VLNSVLLIPSAVGTSRLTSKVAVRLMTTSHKIVTLKNCENVMK